MSDFQPGEVVDITIRGARVVEHRGQSLAFSYPCFGGQDFPGEMRTNVDVDSDHVTVERVAPAEWPPQPGDLWRDRDGFLHFAASYSPDYDDAEDSRGIDADGCRVVLLSKHSDESCRPGHKMHRPENVIQQCGPLTLVYREGQEAAVVHAKNLSCQGLQMLDPDHPALGGVPVVGFPEEMKRRGEDHVYGCELIGHRADEQGGVEAAEDGAPAKYPEPGSEIPGQPGYVVGTCGHRVAGSEWRAGFKTCERCPHKVGDES